MRHTNMRHGVWVLTALVAAFCLAGCGNNVLLDETHSLPDNKWLRFEPEEFHFEVSDINACYNLSITVNYDTTLLTDRTLPLSVDYFSDVNEQHHLTRDIPLIDHQGNRRGDVLGRYCTISDTIGRYQVFNRKGEYTYRIKQRTSRYEMNGVSSINLKVVKSVKI